MPFLLAPLRPTVKAEAVDDAFVAVGQRRKAHKPNQKMATAALRRRPHQLGIPKESQRRLPLDFTSLSNTLNDTPSEHSELEDERVGKKL